MSGHIAWDKLRPMSTPHQRDVQMAYLDGYRMGVEDSLQELRAYQTRVMDRPEILNAPPETAGTIVQVISVVFKGARTVVARNLKAAQEAIKLVKGVS